MAFLRHTKAKMTEREALTVNPAKTCQPIGAMYAALGIHGCLPHSHGSQGCCSYHRSTLTRHYKEPVMASTSSFTEGSAVFGGQSNLLQAIETIFTTYDPEIIAVHTTCLSETIGDDLVQIIGKAREEGKIPKGKRVIHASTPSYVGSHVTGFSNMVKAMVKLLAEPSDIRLRKINLIPGWVEPSDMREIKRILDVMKIDATMFPDTSGILDSPQSGKFEMFPEGGVTVAQMAKTGANCYTLALGPTTSLSAAQELESKCKIPGETIELPIGLGATDTFVETLRRIGMVEIPKTIEEERGRLVDVMSDMHQYFYQKRVALWGDPDQLVSLAGFLCDLDMKPVYIVTGTPDPTFEARIAKAMKGRVPEAKVRQGPCSDMFLMHQWIKEEPVDLLIGNTYGKYISRDENTPFVRHGFPILDRVGHSYFPSVGYVGGLRLLEKMLDGILDHKDRTSPEESFELVM
ncbi:MAG: nitrogenase molybdenum-iron protein subunit beta [Victivallales bacterium]